jgi:hypothetical protein
MRPVRVGLLWRNEWDPLKAGTDVAESCRLHGVFAAFQDLGVVAEPVIYADDWNEPLRESCRLHVLRGWSHVKHIESFAGKIGCTPETPRSWVRRA